MDDNDAAKQAGAIYERSLKSALRKLDHMAPSPAPTPSEPDANDPRLMMLHALVERLIPIMQEIPEGADLFNTGLVPGPTPRYWIDMLSFVEMGPDGMLYRFLQDGRQGRMVITETRDVDAMADAATAYVAQRLIERERQLSGLDMARGSAPANSPAYGSPYGGAPQAPPAAGWGQSFTQVLMPPPGQAAPPPPAPPPAQTSRLDAFRSAFRPAPAPHSNPVPEPAPQSYANPYAHRSQPTPFAPAPPHIEPQPMQPDYSAPATPQWPPASAPSRPAMAGRGFSWITVSIAFLLGIGIGAAGIIAFALSAGR